MQRRTRLLVAALVAVAGAALAFAGASPPALATVSDAVAMGPGETVDVRGTIKAGTVDRANATFVVTDGARELTVRYDRPLPEHEAGGTLEERLVVVSGVLADDGGARVLLASAIKVGCASKYEVEK